MSSSSAKRNAKKPPKALALIPNDASASTVHDALKAETPWAQYLSALTLQQQSPSDVTFEKKILPLLRNAALAGHPGAQHALADAFERGRGVEQSDLLSKYWKERAMLKLNTPELWNKESPDELVQEWKKRAETGDAIAKFSVGWLYDEGIGVKSDATLAVELYRQAAKANHAGAARNLGKALLVGYGTRREVPMAVVWLYRAARASHPQAQRDLGALFASGEGVAKSADEAMRWFIQAAEKGDARALVEYAEAIQRGAVRTNNDAETVLRSLQLAAAQGSVKAYTALSAYHHQQALPGSAAEAFRWALAGAEEADAASQIAVAKFCIDGHGCEANAFEAVLWLRRAAEAKGECSKEAERLLRHIMRTSPQLIEWRHTIRVAMLFARAKQRLLDASALPPAPLHVLALPRELLVHVLLFTVRRPHPDSLSPALNDVFRHGGRLNSIGAHSGNTPPSKNQNGCSMQ